MLNRKKIFDAINKDKVFFKEINDLDWNGRLIKKMINKALDEADIQYKNLKPSDNSSSKKDCYNCQRYPNCNRKDWRKCDNFKEIVYSSPS